MCRKESKDQFIVPSTKIAVNQVCVYLTHIHYELMLSCTHMLIHSRTHTYTHTHTLIHSYTHTLIHSHTHTLIHSYTHTLTTLIQKQLDLAITAVDVVAPMAKKGAKGGPVVYVI